MRFDRKKFFDAYRPEFGSLTPQQVKGLERLLTGIENDPHIPEPPIGIFYASYMLTTVKRETAHTFTPIHEYGGKAYFVKRYGGQTKKGRELGNDTPEEGYFYAGKSDVQVTGESNYEKSEDAVRREYPELVLDFERRTGKAFDLTVGDQAGDERDPMNILDPKISYAVMSYGMRTGMFTGRKLSQYIKAGKPDYVGMRKIINGTDHDDEIAADARKFEKILRASLISNSAAPQTPPRLDSNLGQQAAEDIKTDGAAGAKVEISAEGDVKAETNQPEFVPEDKTMTAPAGDGAEAKSQTMTILGIAVPSVLVPVIATVKSAFENGYLDAKEILGSLLTFLQSNYKYVFILIAMIIAVMLVKKAFKQLTFLLQMYINARHDMHNVTVEPSDK